MSIPTLFAPQPAAKFDTTDAPRERLGALREL